MSTMKNELPIITPDIDYTQVAPIHQKRSLAFINHFIIRTVTFLNNFSQACESRLLEFEHKITNIEASLSILESKLISIPGLDDLTITNKKDHVETGNDQILLEISPEVKQINEPKVNNDNLHNSNDESKDQIKAKDDPRFSKFFKMLQFGVPEQAVKLKMQGEGIDPNILNNPSGVIPGYEHVNNELSDSESSSS